MLIEKHIRYRIIRLLLVVLSPWCCCWTHYYCGIVGRCTGLLEFSTKPARAFSVPTISVHSRLASSTTTRRMASSSESDQRRPWDFIRFIQQSSRFVPSPFAPPRLGPVPQGKVKPQPGDVLWSPGSQNAFQFAPLDDVVMGGASASDFDNRLGIWKGRVTDANNGGFIGIRNTPYFDWDMSNCQGLEFTLKSPIRSGRYKIGLRDRKEFNGIVWNTSVDVSTSVTKVRHNSVVGKIRATHALFVTKGTSMNTFMTCTNTRFTLTLSYSYFFS